MFAREFYEDIPCLQQMAPSQWLASAYASRALGTLTSICIAGPGVQPTVHCQGIPSNGHPPCEYQDSQFDKQSNITENVHGKSKVKHREEATKGTSLDPHLGHIVAGPSMRFLRARKGAWAAQGMGSLSSKPSPLACSGGPLGAWCSPHHPGQAPLVNRVQVSC